MARIEIKGVIGQDYTFKQLVNDFASAKDEPIRLFIDSVGGYVEEGERMAEFIAKKADRFESVQNSGNVASIASSIFLSLPFEKRYFNPSNGVALIHNPYISPKDMKGMDTTAAGLSYLSSEMHDSENRIAHYIARQTAVDIDVVRALMTINEPLTEEQLESINFAQIMRFKAVAYLKTEKMEKEDVETMINQSHETLWSRFVALLNRRTKFVAIVMTDANGAQLEFPDVPEGTSPAVGDTARMVDGGTPSGEIVMADGSTYVFDAGVLKEIRPAVEVEDKAKDKAEEIEEQPDTEALQARITELEAANSELEKKVSEGVKAQASLRAQIKSEMIEVPPVEKTEKTDDSRLSELQEMKMKTISKNK
jgi:ATP-dependent protease ClpP protease subunit